MANPISIRTACTTSALVVAAWLAGCVVQAPPPDEGSGPPAASGGAGPSTSTGGSHAAGHGGSGGAASGTGGAATTPGTGGSRAGTGGMTPPPTGNADANGPGTPDTGAPGGDAAVPSAAGPGYATCTVCHGPEGAGTDKGPDIQHPVLDYATWVVRNGRTHPGFMMPMPKYLPAMLSDADLQKIFSYLAARPKPTTGAELYKDYCQNCHGADGKGGVTMRTLAAKPVTKFLTDVRAGHHPGEFVNRREYMPKWSAAELSDADIRAIFMHVSGL